MATVEKATLKDVPQLCDLLRILFTQEADFQPDAGKQSAGLRRIIEHPEVGFILVSRDGPTVAGMINVLYSVSTVCGGPVAIFEDMVVRPEKRGSGLGSTLLRCAIEMVQAEGCLPRYGVDRPGKHFGHSLLPAPRLRGFRNDPVTVASSGLKQTSCGPMKLPSAQGAPRSTRSTGATAYPANMLGVFGEGPGPRETRGCKKGFPGERSH